MSKIIEVLMEVVIFSAVIGTIATSVSSGSNLSGAALTLYGLTTLFIVIGFIYTVMKTSGVGRR